MFDLPAIWDALGQGWNWLLDLGFLVGAWLLGRFQAVAARRAESAIDGGITRISQ